ncbi:virulence-associated protein VagC [Catenulispora sp. GP43]
MTRGGYYVPRLIMADGRSRILAPLTVRTQDSSLLAEPVV